MLPWAKALVKGKLAERQGRKATSLNLFFGHGGGAAKSSYIEHAGGESMRIGRFFTRIIIILIILLTSFPSYAQGVYFIDTEQSSQGIFTVDYSIGKDDKVKVMVQKDGTSLYYNLISSKGSETFPLQLGEGSYTVSVLENISGNRYRQVLQQTVDVSYQKPLTVFLQSVQMINWDDKSPAVKKAQELTADKGSEGEKVTAIYDYIIQNFSYDFDKTKLPYDYVPNINEIIKDKKGICYDFSSVFASMLRSVGIPAKLVKGYGNKIKGYHAWNEVYIDGHWKLIDTSFDVQMVQNGQACSMYKDEKDYTKESEF